jgi:CRISPR-associated protein Csb2
MKYIQFEFEKNFRASASILRSGPEWPPSPWRAYCSLVQAHYFLKNGEYDVNRQTLLSLENKLPIILTKPHGGKHDWHRYVPDNVFISDQTSNKGKFRNIPNNFPFVVTDKVWFGYDVEESEWADINKLLPCIRYLGRTDSLVEATDTAPNGELMAWHPDSNGKESLRCPYKGCLGDLDLKHARQLEHVSPEHQHYAISRYLLKEGEFSIQKPYWKDYFICSLDCDMIFNAAATVMVTKAVRTALGKQANTLGLKTLEQEIFSHTKEDHFAYLALPAISGSFPSGEIKGIIIAIPNRLKGMAADLGKCIQSLPSFPVEDYGFGKLAERKEMVALSPRFWCDSARVWTTATPMAIAFYNSKKRDTGANQEYIRRECNWHGLPTPVKIEFSQVAKWGGSCQNTIVPANCPMGYMTHVTLTFPHSVKGPITLGRNRNFGLGLFYPYRGT